VQVLGRVLGRVLGPGPGRVLGPVLGRVLLRQRLMPLGRLWMIARVW
jgi:hypothetical protein